MKPLLTDKELDAVSAWWLTGSLVRKCSAMISQLRLDFMEETLTVQRLTSAAPPVVRTVQEVRGHYEVIEEAEPADANGRNLSAAMVTLIGSLGELSFYAPRYPVRRALAEWERTCRRRHRLPSWTDHALGPVCATMLRSMVEGGTSLKWAAEQAGISYPRADRLVSAGERFVMARLVHWEHERAEIALDPDCEMCRTRRSPSFHDAA